MHTLNFELPTEMVDGGEVAGLQQAIMALQRQTHLIEKMIFGLNLKFTEARTEINQFDNIALEIVFSEKIICHADFFLSIQSNKNLCVDCFIVIYRTSSNTKTDTITVSDNNLTNLFLFIFAA